MFRMRCGTQVSSNLSPNTEIAKRLDDTTTRQDVVHPNQPIPRMLVLLGSEIFLSWLNTLESKGQYWHGSQYKGLAVAKFMPKHPDTIGVTRKQLSTLFVGEKHLEPGFFFLLKTPKGVEMSAREIALFS